MKLADRFDRFFARPPKAAPGEEFVLRAEAMRTTAYPRTYAGSLFLSKHRCHFSPNIANRVVGARPWDAPWDEIEAVALGSREHALTGAAYPELQLSLAGGRRETFTGLGDPEVVIAWIERLRG